MAAWLKVEEGSKVVLTAPHDKTPALRLLARWEGYEGESLEQLVRSKYSYVVSCQLYGTHKRNRDPKAADTEFLLQRFPNLRVAYVDKTSTLTKVREPDGTLALRETSELIAELFREGAPAS